MPHYHQKNTTGSTYTVVLTNGALAVSERPEMFEFLAGDAPGTYQGLNYTSMVSMIKTSNYTMTLSDKLILANATSGGFTVTLPLAATVAPEDVYTIQKTDDTGNIIAVASQGSETIQGASSQSLDAQWEAMNVRSNGINWYISGTN